MLKRIRKFFTLENSIVLGILILAFIVRVFRVDEILAFHYDQGRDALVVWDMIYNAKPTLIGPMMGFTGMFRGGWYYWLIAPFYYLGHGNPLFPSIFLIIISVVAVYLLYILGKRILDARVGILAALIASVSMYIIGASRWLSNPTPTLLISLLLVWSLFKYSDSKKRYLIFSAFLVGLALQFSSAAEIFYLPAIIIIVFLFRKKNKLSFIEIILALISLIIPFIPQILFELRHPGVQSGALFNFLFREKTFTYAFWEILRARLHFDYSMIASKFWINGDLMFLPFFIVFLFLLVRNWKNFWKSDKFKIVFILGISPLIGTLFFVSNLGGVYEYYFTGYYLIWILLFSFVFVSRVKSGLVKIFLSIFIIILMTQNLIEFKKTYSVSQNDLRAIVLGNQISAIDWVYQNAGSNNFNVDEYVPPVIPYSYNYLFRWLGTTKYSKLPTESQLPLLYTLYEADPDHPERLKAWLDRQKGIGHIVKEESFGGITVQKRKRILYSK